jgi:hypothetical protein
MMESSLSKSKVIRVNQNRFRNWSLAFLFGGFFIMYSGMFSKSLLPVLLVVGGISVVIGMLLYFRYGPVSSQMYTTLCPRCGASIRLTGKADACNHCGLTLRKTPTGEYEPYVAESSGHR